MECHAADPPVSTVYTRGRLDELIAQPFRYKRQGEYAAEKDGHFEDAHASARGDCQ